MKQYKVIRGYYLTGLGQETHAYYFKIPEDQAEFKTIQAGDVAVTFYQNQEAITHLPALIRVDGIITAEKTVEEYLLAEQKDGFPMLPLLEIYQQFDPLLFKNVMVHCQKMQDEIAVLARQKRQEGDKE